MTFGLGLCGACLRGGFGASGFACCCVNVMWLRVVFGDALLVWCVLVVRHVGLWVELWGVFGSGVLGG